MGMGFLIFIAGFGAILTPMVTGMIAERVGIVGGMATISITMVLMLAFSIIVYLRTRKAN
jgi:fucose permease